jgi:hypothetical protein
MRQIHRQLVTSGKSEDAANVISMFVRHHDRVKSAGAAPNLASLVVAARVEKPQSSSTFVSPASTIRALPLLPLPSDAKRITSTGRRAG